MQVIKYKIRHYSDDWFTWSASNFGKNGSYLSYNTVSKISFVILYNLFAWSIKEVTNRSDIKIAIVILHPKQNDLMNDPVHTEYDIRNRKPLCTRDTVKARPTLLLQEKEKRAV